MTKNMSIVSCCPLSVGDSKSKDLLGFTPSVDALQTIVQSLRPPFTIGVYGDWGSGKTSYMRMLFDELETHKEKFIPIWFNAWKYESEGSVVLPLLSKMAEQCKDNAQASDKFKSVKKIATAVTLIGANIGLKAVTANLVSLDNIEKALSRAEGHLSDAYDTWVSKCDKLESGFKELTDTLTENGKKTVVVFIDDLDRCAPENVVKLLESIKNYLSVEDCHCLFVIGVDKQIIVKGIRAKYGSDLIDGDEYLEKIISYSVDVPEGTSECVQAYVINTIKAQLNTERYNTLEKEIAIVATAISKYAIYNPRKLKRIIPRLIFFLLKEDYKEYLIECIVYLVILREFYQKVFIDKEANKSAHYQPNFTNESRKKYLTPGQNIEQNGEVWAELFGFQSELLTLQDDDCIKVMNTIRNGKGAVPEKYNHLDGHSMFNNRSSYFKKVNSLFVLN